MRNSDRSKAALEVDLAAAEVRAAQGQGCIDRQERLLHDLRRDGHETVAAASLLETMRDTQRLHEADVDRLKSELALFNQSGV